MADVFNWAITRVYSTQLTRENPTGVPYQPKYQHERFSLIYRCYNNDGRGGLYAIAAHDDVYVKPRSMFAYLRYAPPPVGPPAAPYETPKGNYEIVAGPWEAE